MPRVLTKEGVYRKAGSKCYYMGIRVDDENVVNRSTRMRTKEAAKQVYWAERERLLKEALNIHSDKTPDDILPLWKTMAESEFGAKYIAAVEDDLKRHWQSLMAKPVARITQEEVHAIEVKIRASGFMPETINKAINAFSCLITFAIKRLGWFKYVEFRFERERVVPKSKDVVGKHHVVAFLAAIAANGNILALLCVAMMLGLGLRECEVLHACWANFVLGIDGHLLYKAQSKDGPERLIPVPEWLEVMIRNYEAAILSGKFRFSKRAGRPRGGPKREPKQGVAVPAERDWLFPNARGVPYSQGYTSRYIKAACSQLGLPSLSPHRMRGSAANLLKLEGLSPDEIQKILGHASIVTTSLYLTQSHAVARTVQNALGRQLFPGAGSALRELREQAQRQPVSSLLPKPAPPIEALLEMLATIDSPAMKFLPPLDPGPPPAVDQPDQGEKDAGSIAAGVRAISFSPRPARPTKELLRELVWRVPTSTLAKLFGVSDTTIANWCDEDGIPKPPRGFWAKLLPTLNALRREFGQETEG